jgi:hypothetical protein
MREDDDARIGSPSGIVGFLSSISWASIAVGAVIGLPLWLTMLALTSRLSPEASGVWELAIGVVLGGVTAWVIPEFIDYSRGVWKRSRPLRAVLGPSCVNGEPTVIFLGSLYPSETRSFIKTVPLQPDGRMTVIPMHGMPWVLVENDARALAFTMAILANAGKTENLTILRDDFGLEVTDASFVCIGGIKNNLKTKQINDSFQEIPLRYVWEGDKVVIRSQTDGRTWETDEEYDYAVLSKVLNEYDTSKVVFIVGGISHTGTAGAAYYLWTKWPEIVRERGGGFFAYVVKVRRDNFQYARVDYSAPLSVCR